MADALKYLPQVLTDFTPIHTLVDSLHLPKPTSIKPLLSSGAFHVIYILTYPPSVLSEILTGVPCHGSFSSTNLILRVSGSHYASIKTQNECAAMRWVALHTNVPVPAVVRYDCTENNALGREFIIMTQARGETLDKIYGEWDKLEEDVKLKFFDRLTDIVHEMQAHSWDKIGGVKEIQSSDGKTTIVPGPIIDETMWQVPEFASLWEGKETHDSLNISGPFESWTDLLEALASKHLYAIQTHPSLEPVRDLVPAIEKYRAALKLHKADIDDTRFCFAHRDLHFGNILYDMSTHEITCIIDWEFASVVPVPRWDPSRAFLWTAQNQESDIEIKNGLRDIVFKRAKDRGLKTFEEVEYKNERQKDAQLAERFLGAICQVLPRGRSERPWQDWKKTFLEHLGSLTKD